METKANGLVVVQFMSLDVSAVPIWCWSPRDVLECYVAIPKKWTLIPAK